MFKSGKSAISKIENAHLSAETLAEASVLLKKFTVEQLESIPEFKNLIVALMEEKTTKQQMAASLNVLPSSEVHKLFREYIESHFDSYLQSFFDKLHRGLLKILHGTVGKRIEMVENQIADLKKSLVLSVLNPYGVIDAQITKESIAYLETMPGGSASVHELYKYLTYSANCLVPGSTLTDKYVYLTTVLRKVECLKEWQGFVFELQEVAYKEDIEEFTSDPDHQNKIKEAVDGLVNNGDEKKETSDSDELTLNLEELNAESDSSG